MPVPDGKMRGHTVNPFSTWESLEIARIDRCNHQSAGLPSSSNRRTRRLSMLSILPVSNAALELT
jgi:hypothetical protein